jgi:hypothetical protein
MFGPMKEALRGRFSSDKEVGAVENWLKTQPKNFFSVGSLKKLVKRWNRCVEVEWDSVSFVTPRVVTGE